MSDLRYDGEKRLVVTGRAGMLARLMRGSVTTVTEADGGRPANRIPTSVTARGGASPSKPTRVPGSGVSV